MQQDWKSVGSYGTVGLELGLSVLFGLACGHWLDQRLHTAPWLTLIGTAFGLAAGARAVWRALRRANREADQIAEQERHELKEPHD
ncbi:MAG: AtpZ/AtpI family protein [Polyangiaceae bacterium]|nr:AtpZ/AtpI family protein [Polyangiaceae bacterium]